jgi:inner membrane protein
MAGMLHVAVGVAAGRAAARVHPVRLMAVLGFLSLAPDLDVLAFAYGIPYEAEFGHRGASHSIAVALVVGALCSLGAREWHLSRLRMFLVVSAVVASHGLLDSLTNGGLGIALAWPFSDHRFFACWRPIPVSPMGKGLVSEYGQHVLLVETLASIPLLAYAFWPRRGRRPSASSSGGDGESPAPKSDP